MRGKTMKRVLVYGLVGTNRGGIETFLLKMCRNMSDQIVFDYVVEGNVCIHAKEITDRGGRIYFIHQRRKRPLANILDNKRLLKKLRTECDVAYFNLSSLSWISPIVMAEKLGYKVFVHSHNAGFIRSNSGLFYRALNRINKTKLKKLNVTRLTCSKYATEFLFGDSPDVRMIYNAIDAKGFAFDSAARALIREEYGVPSNDLLIGFVGRLQYQKNPLFVCEVFREILLRIPGCKFVIVGDGDMKNEMQSKLRSLGIENNVFFAGNCTNVNAYFSAMDFFVLPSLHEGLPYVAIEAQAAGLQCFLSSTITDEVNVNELVHFLPISNGPSLWADAIYKSHPFSFDKRLQLNSVIANSRFDIANESKVLEGLLCH